MTTTAIVGADHLVTFKLPDEVPMGEIKVTILVESEHGTSTASRKMTPSELATSEFAGAWAEGDGYPKTTDEFVDWRRKIWTQNSP